MTELRLGWDAYFATKVLLNGSDADLPVTGVINFIGSEGAVEHDQTNGVTNVYLGDGGGGDGDLSVTGTGFVHATGGDIDGAAKLVANADVAANANIAVSKLANADANDKVLRRGSDGTLAYGQVDLSKTAAVTGLGTSTRLLYNNGGRVGDISGVAFDGTNLNVGLPQGGDASSPRRNRVITLLTPGGTVTPDATITACPELVIATNTDTIYLLPNVNGAHFFVRNQGTGTHTFKVSAQTGVAIADGENVEIFCDGNDYKRASESSGGGGIGERVENEDDGELVDVATTGVGLICFKGTAVVLQSLVEGYDGHWIILRNRTGFAMTIAHEDGGEGDAPGIQCPGHVDLSLPDGHAVLAFFDVDAGPEPIARWVIVGLPSAGHGIGARAENEANGDLVDVATSGVGLLCFKGSSVVLQSLSEGDDGHWLMIRNRTGFAMTIAHNDGGAGDAQGIICPGGVDLSLPDGHAVQAFFDVDSDEEPNARWVIVGPPW